MSRCRILWDRLGKLAEFKDDVLIWSRKGAFDGVYASGPQIMRDIDPYQSMINGQMITSRSHHRAHLRDNGYVEVGNDTSHTKSRPVPKNTRRQTLHKQLADMSDKQANKILKQLRKGS